MKKQSILLMLAFTLLLAGRTDKAGEEPLDTEGLTIRMDVNKIDLAFHNNGDIGWTHKTYYPKGSQLTFLQGAGLGLSGYVNDSLRTAWTYYDNYAEAYAPGIWGMTPEDPLARFYSVNAADEQGSSAYLDWANAVSLGAPFNDVDGDGQYEAQIDTPPDLGDKLVWTVFNDNTLPQENDNIRTEPLGVEIQQTLWAYNSEGFLGEIVFFHYRIINRSGKALEEMIFSSLVDPDLGYHNDDLIGCDTILQMGYVYNDGPDPDYGYLPWPGYGDNPPAFAMKILQGPQTNQPHAQTVFWNIDNLTTKTLENIYAPGFSSFIYFFHSHPTLGDPNNPVEARRYQVGGQNRLGEPIDPVSFGFGTGAVPGTNPKYLYNGDPVAGTGWLDDPPSDKRFFINSGPFEMSPGDTSDILLAMIVARGNDALDSITEVRKRARFLQRMLHEDARELRIYCKQDSFDMDFAAHLKAEAMGLTKASRLPFDTQVEWSIDQKPQDGVAVLLALDSLKAVFQAYHPGAYTIKALLTHEGGETDTIYKTLYATDGPSGLDSDEQTAGNFHLRQNYPNPFNPSTTIVYELPRREKVNIQIYDSAGRKVATLLDGPQNAGRHELDFKAAHLASGVYYYRLTAGRFVQTRKMLLIK